MNIVDSIVLMSAFLFVLGVITTLGVFPVIVLGEYIAYVTDHKSKKYDRIMDKVYLTILVGGFGFLALAFLTALSVIPVVIAVGVSKIY